MVVFGQGDLGSLGISPSDIHGGAGNLSLSIAIIRPNSWATVALFLLHLLLCVISPCCGLNSSHCFMCMIHEVPLLTTNCDKNMSVVTLFSQASCCYLTHFSRRYLTVKKKKKKS